jgi:hypothetical protein
MRRVSFLAAFVVVLVVFAFVFGGSAAGAANLPFLTLSVTGGSPTTFTSNDVTSTALPSSPTITVRVNVTTVVGGTITITSPSNPIGVGGAMLDLSTITATCTDMNNSGWLIGGSAQLVPGGSSLPCATISPLVVLGQTNMKVVLTMNVTTAIADTWTIPGFVFGGIAT